jgi:DNA methyltransferase 1-associated protein 1
MAPQSTSSLALTASFLSPAAHAIAANAAGLAGLSVGNSSKKRRRGELDMLEDPTGTASKLGPAGISAQAAVPQFTPEQDAALGITRYDSLGPASSIMRPAGVYLRSSKPPALKTSLAPRIQAVLAEQKINMRLAMPTRANMERLEALVQTITALLDCKKQVERAEGELKMLKIRKGAALRVEAADRLQAQEAQGDEVASSQGHAPASRSATPMPDQSSRASSMQVDG